MPYGYSPVIQDIEIANFIKKLYEVNKKYFVKLKIKLIMLNSLNF